MEKVKDKYEFPDLIGQEDIYRLETGISKPLQRRKRKFPTVADFKSDSPQTIISFVDTELLNIETPTNKSIRNKIEIYNKSLAEKKELEEKGKEVGEKVKQIVSLEKEIKSDLKKYRAKDSIKRLVEVQENFGGLPEDEQVETWLNLIMENDWNLLMEREEQNTFRPEIAWLDMLKTNACASLSKIKDSFQTQEKFDLFTTEITKRCWEYYWREQVPNRIDNAIHTIKSFGGPWINKRKYEELREIQGLIRKKMGHARKPKRLYTQVSKGYKIKNRDWLIYDLFKVFKHRINGSKSSICRNIADLLIKFRIEEGDKIKVVERTRKVLYRKFPEEITQN